MKKDIEIAREAKIKDIEEIANYLEISDYEKYGKYKAKINPCFDVKKDSKLVLVTATIDKQEAQMAAELEKENCMNVERCRCDLDNGI